MTAPPSAVQPPEAPSWHLPGPLVLRMMAVAVCAVLLAGVGGYAALRGVDPSLHMLGQVVVDASTNYGMSVLPMFILMGLFVHKADISGELYENEVTTTESWRWITHHECLDVDDFHIRKR